MKNIKILLLLTVFAISGCANKNNTEICTYYEDGTVKTKKVLNSANDTLNYYLESYYPDGTIFQSGHFKNGKTEGLVKQYSENSNLKIVTTYINGLKNGYQRSFDLNGNVENEYYFEDDTVLLMYNYIEDKGVKVYTEFEGKLVLIGMLTLEDDDIVKDKSYYYALESNDTLKVGKEEAIELEVFNQGKSEKSIEVILIDRFGKFESIDNKIITSDNLSTQFIIKPIKSGYTVLTGVVNIKGRTSEIEKQFYLHKLYYIEDN